MTSIEKHQGAAVAAMPDFAPVLTTAPLSPLERMEQEAMQLDVSYKLAKSLCRTSLVPQHFRGKPEDGAVAIMAGAAWGLGAVAALQNIFIVHGTPSTFARVMKAVVQGHGHTIRTAESGPDRVVVRGWRAGSDTDGEPDEESTWTIQRAEQAGYLKQNQKYRTEPENMLYARATAEVSRRLAPDALLGMPYSREELDDLPRYVQATATAPGVAGLAAALGAAPAAAAAEVDAEQSGDDPAESVAEESAPEPAPREDVPVEPKKATARQRATVQARLDQERVPANQVGDMLTAWLEREVNSLDELTNVDVAAIDKIFADYAASTEQS